MTQDLNSRARLLCVMKILSEKSDEEHGLDMCEILTELEKYGISGERKAIYRDIDALRDFGIDIITVKKDRNYFYYIGSRDFELAELKLLVDSVQSAKFITQGKSNELIGKIERLTSEPAAKKLQRQVYVTERVKSMNESIYYNIDALHNAISMNRRIAFRYFSWNVDKKQELRHDGALYRVSPWALLSDSENYYAIVYDSEDAGIRHFRIDKMLGIELLDEERDGRDVFDRFDMAVYQGKMFGMFVGTEETVKLRCENYLANVIIDRFGKDVILIRDGDEHFTVNVRVAVSNQFLGWVFSLGSGAKIAGPESVVGKMNDEIERLIRQYRDQSLEEEE